MNNILKNTKITNLVAVAFTLFFVCVGSACAKTLDINDVASKFQNTSTIEKLNEYGGDITSKLNTDENRFDIFYSDGEKKTTFTFTDEYIEYDGRDIPITQENIGDNFVMSFWMAGIMEAIFELSGFENITLSQVKEEDFIDTFDTYGIQMESEHYNFSDSSEDEEFSMSGDYLKYFKISLDTDKISKLIEEFGEPIKNDNSNEELFKDLTPELEAGDITDNSIVLYPKLPNYVSSGGDFENTPFCYVYRSSSEDGPYARISDISVSCTGGIGITDKDLISNTTYYYKTRVMTGSNFSDVIAVTTKAKEEKIKNSTVDNPKTGIYFPTLGIIAIITFALIFLIKTRRKGTFKQL